MNDPYAQGSRDPTTRWTTDRASGSQPPAGVAVHTHAAGDLPTSVTLGVVPVGVPVPWPSATAPTGWVICNGAAVPAGCPILTSLYGANLPDLRGTFIIGKAASGTGSTLLGTGGSKDAIAVSHNHTQNAHNHGTVGHSHGGLTTNDGSHDHAEASAGSLPLLVKVASALGLATPGDGQATYDTGKVGRTSSDGVHQHVISSDSDSISNFTATNQSAGSSGTDANLPPFVAFNYIVQAA